MGFGNLLYVALWVHQGRRVGEHRAMRVTPTLQRWLQDLPELGALCVGRGEVRFSDQRLSPWSPAQRASAGPWSEAVHGTTQALNGTAAGRGFSDLDLASFIDAYLEPSLQSARHSSSRGEGDRLIVNVRRGDYYSVPELRSAFAFDLDTYLRTAVTGALADSGPVDEIHVVSDGLDWCRARLHWLADLAPRLTWADPASTSFDHFTTLIRADRLVMTNSTFSYWAAYVGDRLRGHSGRRIRAPRFFDRTVNDGRSWWLDTSWDVVEDIPGGWDS